MDDFKGIQEIRLRQGDTGVPCRFQITICSAEGANDGAIPYGTVVSSVDVKAYRDANDTDVTSDMVDSSSVVDNVVLVDLNYPSLGAGRYRLEMVCTLTGGITRKFECDRIIAED